MLHRSEVKWLMDRDADGPYERKRRDDGAMFGHIRPTHRPKLTDGSQTRVPIGRYP
jgi:hypothetical protein